MKWTVGKKIGTGFALAMIAMSIIGISSYFALNKLVEAAYWRGHTYQVLHLLTETSSDLKDAETGQRGYILTGEDHYLEPYNAARSKVDEDIGEIRKLTEDNPNQQKRIAEVKAKATEKLSELAETIALRKEKGLDAAREVVLTDKGKNIMDEIRALIGEMIDEENTLMEKRSSQVDANTRNAKFVIVGGMLVALVLLTLTSLLVSRSIAKPLSVISTIASRAAAGDLSTNVPAEERTDEVGMLTRAFRQMVENLRSSVADTTEGIALLGSSSSEILASTTQVASGTAETATAISETSTTVEEVRQAARLSSDKAKNLADSAQRVAQVSQSGQKAVEETAAGMLHIRDQMESIAQTIVRLSEQSQSIGGIIASVTDLADQSNLLAVNAAIEAARTGEHGKGFAVVAQEIKSLAEQSKQATAQVRSILNDVQKATSAAVMATEQGSKAVDAGVKQSAQAGEAIRVLAESSREAAQTAVQIVASSQQQVVGMDQIGVAMESINQAGAQTAASMRQAEIAAQNLHELGQKLKQLVEQYQT